jgi:hypothetical protein
VDGHRRHTFDADQGTRWARSGGTKYSRILADENLLAVEHQRGKPKLVQGDPERHPGVRRGRQPVADDPAGGRHAEDEHLTGQVVGNHPGEFPQGPLLLGAGRRPGVVPARERAQHQAGYESVGQGLGVAEHPLGEGWHRLIRRGQGIQYRDDVWERQAAPDDPRQRAVPAQPVDPLGVPRLAGMP